MNLWIRSQSKEILMKVTKVHICGGVIFASGYTEFDERIGKYATKERAIEILDEIQDELISSDFMPIEKNEEVVLTCGSARIYEMPAE